MASVDLNTGKIYGCKKYSRVWWHEKGHLAFADTEFGARISYYFIFFQMTAVFVFGLSLLYSSIFIRALGFCFALAMLFSYFYEEIWCWIYSFSHYNSK